MKDLKSYNTVQEMLDDIDPEFGEEFRKYMRRPRQRIESAWFWFRYLLPLKVKRLFRSE